MPLALGSGIALTLTSPVSGLVAPEGFAFVIDENGAYVTDAAEAYVIAEIV